MSHYGPDYTDRYAGGQAGPRGIHVRNSVDIGGFLSILGRQWFWIFAGFAIAFGLAFVYITFAPLTYTSTISILIDARDRQPIGSDQQPLPQQADPVMVESQLKLMTSQAVLRRVVADEHLESDPEFAPSDHAGLLSRLTRFAERGTVTAPAIEQITETLFDRISVKRPDRTYVVDMDVKAGNPSKAARLADAVAKAFLDEERAAADAFTQDQSDWIIKRTDELRTKLELAEKKVQDYKAANGIVDVAGTLTQEQQLQDANRDLVAARGKAAEAQSRVDQIRRIIASGKALDGTYDTINSTVIRQLRVQYSDLVRRQAAASQKFGTRHPDYLDIEEQIGAIKGQINDEMQRISSALTNEAQVARGNEDAAQKRVQILEAKTTNTNQVSLQLRELQRQADSERANYEKFLRANDSIRRDLTETPYARIVAPASFPSRPSSPKVIAALLIALSGGLTLGVGLAAIVDYQAFRRRSRHFETVPGIDPGPDRFPTGPSGHGPGFDPGAGPTQGPPDGPPGNGGDRHDHHDASEHQTGDGGQRPVDVHVHYPDDRAVAHGGFGRIRSVVTKRRPLVADRRHRDDISAPAEPGTPVETGVPHEATAPQEIASQAHRANAPLAGVVDPRDLLQGFLSDLDAQMDRRFVLTANTGSIQKTELALAMARAAAAHGHGVLVIDGDDGEQALSLMAMRDGLPARIEFAGMELNVLGIPGSDGSVVFVLPLEATTGSLDIVDIPKVAVRIGALIVDGPAAGPGLNDFAHLTDTCYWLDERGFLRLIPLGQATVSGVASGSPDEGIGEFTGGDLRRLAHG